MQTYLPLKRFFTQGEFYGIDEMVHAHTLPELRESVLNVFNLDRQAGGEGSAIPAGRRRFAGGFGQA